jgi:Tfp pilus assembly protein PilF
MNENIKSNSKVELLNTFARVIPILLAFLVPLFFLPITLEYFSFNKLTLVTVATVLLVIYWATKMMLGEKVSFVKSSIDLPLLAFLLVMGIATFFSISKVDSIWGSQGRWLGLFSTAIFLIYFFLSTPLLKSKRLVKLAIYAFLSSITVATLVAIFSYYKIFLGLPGFIKSQSFTLAGSVTDTLLLATLGIIVSLAVLLYQKSLLAKIFLGVAVFFNFYYVLITGTFITYLLLIAGVIAILVFVNNTCFTKNKYVLGVLGLVLGFTLLLAILPATKSVIMDKTYSREAVLSSQNSWLISSTIIQNFPLLATGPATFYLNFSRYRPLALNMGDFWNARFDLPQNELFNVLSTLGLIGFTVVFILGLKTVKLINKAKTVQDDDGLVRILSIALLISSLSFVFAYATALNTFVFFMILGLLIAVHASSNSIEKVSQSVSIEADGLSSIAGVGEESVIKKEYFRYIVGVPVILVTFYVSYLAYKNYAGEYLMKKSLDAVAENNGSAAYDFQMRAININPNRDTYHSTYAQTNLAIANALAAKQDLTDTEKQTIQTLISQAIRSTRIATEVVGPLNPVNWEVRSLIYRSLINVAQNAQEWAVNSYTTAIQLDPTNARLRVDLGGLYFSAKDYLSAANQFRQATALKTDYANAYFNFGNALIQMQDYQNARAALEATKSLLPQDSADLKTINDLIATLPAPATAEGTTGAAKPTVEQIAGQTPATTQEPLKNAAQNETVGNDNLDLGTLPKPTEKKQ